MGKRGGTRREELGLGSGGAGGTSDGKGVGDGGSRKPRGRSIVDLYRGFARILASLGRLCMCGFLGRMLRFSVV